MTNIWVYFDPRGNDNTVIQYPTRVQLQKLRPLYCFILTPGEMVLQKYNTRVQLQKIRPLYTGLFLPQGKWYYRVTT
jgi:hypothetical protein